MEYRQAHMFKKPELVSEKILKQEEEKSLEWQGMVSDGNNREESDVWLSYTEGKWSVDGKEAAFEEIMSSYGRLLNQKAAKDKNLRKILEQSK